MEEIVERIKKVMDDEGMSAAEFADHLGVGRPLLSHVLGGRNNPSLQLILKIMSHFPTISANWLLLGKEAAAEQSPTPIVKKQSKEESAHDIRQNNIPIIDGNSQLALLFYGDGTYKEYKPRK
jgi:transcriptional regulator with XRE-family HTH domain